MDNFENALARLIREWLGYGDTEESIAAALRDALAVRGWIVEDVPVQPSFASAAPGDDEPLFCRERSET